MATFTLTGDVTHDESAGLQTSAVATTTEDNNDNDVATLSALLANYAAGYNRLFNAVAAGGLGLTRPEDTTRTTDGQAVAQVFTMANAAAVTDLGFTDSTGAALNGTSSGFRTTTDKTIRLYTDTLNNIVLGKYDSDGNGSDDATAFALVLEEVRDSNNVITAGKIWIIQFEPIEHLNTASHDEVLDLTNILYVTASEEVVFSDLSKAPSGQNDWLGFGPTGSTADVQLLATGLHPLAENNNQDGDTVNTSTIGLGSNSQSVDPADGAKPAEGIRIDFVKGLNLPPQGGGTGDTKDINGIQFTQHEQGSGAAFRLVQVQGNQNNRVDAKVQVFNADEDQGSGFVAGLTDDPGVNVGLVEVYLVTISKAGVETKTLVRSQNGPAGAETGSDSNVHITISGNTVDLTGLKTNYEVVVRSASGTNVVDRIEITNTTINTSQDNANGFDVGAFRLLGIAGVRQEVGSRTNFEDDGPSLDLTLSGTARLTLDETDNDGDDGQVGGILATASITAANLFSGTASFGSDGEAGTGPNAFALVLGGADNNSGLDTIGGADILLFKEGNDIIGRTGSAAGAMVFKIEIDAATGTVTATQYSAIKHDDPGDHDEADDATDASATTVLQTIATGRVNVSRTVTDGDGDTASDTQDISSVFNFEDDGPDVTLALQANAAIVLDETDNDGDDADGVGGLLANVTVQAAALFTTSAVAGSDGQKSLAYGLALSNAGDDSGLDTVDGTNVLLFADGSDIVGRKGSAAGAEVFRISIDSTTGAVTVTQSLALKHDDAGDSDEADDATDANASVIQAIASGKVAATRSITDNDDDTDSASVDLGPRISFQDDGPSDFTPAAILASENVRNQAGQTATRDLTGSNLTTLAANFAGADGLGSLVWLDTNANDNFLYGTIDGTTGVLKSGGLDISLSGFGTSTLTAATTAGTVFTLTLNSQTDNYTLNMVGQIDNGASKIFNTFGNVASGIRYWYSVNDPVAGGQQDILITGLNPTSSKVNVSTQGLGIDKQSTEPGKALRVDFVEDVKENPNTTDGKTPLLVSEATYDDHYGVNDAGFIINQVTPTGNRVDVRLSLFNETSDPLNYGVLDPADLTNGTPVAIDSVTIYDALGTVVWDETGDKSATDPARFNGTTDVLDLGAKYKVVIHGDATYERMQLLNIDNTHGFDLKGIVIESVDAGDPISMNFDALLRDGDTDLDPTLVSATALATGDIDITLQPPLI